MTAKGIKSGLGAKEVLVEGLVFLWISKVRDVLDLAQSWIDVVVASEIGIALEAARCTRWSPILVVVFE